MIFYKINRVEVRLTSDICRAFCLINSKRLLGKIFQYLIQILDQITSLLSVKKDDLITRNASTVITFFQPHHHFIRDDG